MIINVSGLTFEELEELKEFYEKRNKDVELKGVELSVREKFYNAKITEE